MFHSNQVLNFLCMIFLLQFFQQLLSLKEFLCMNQYGCCRGGLLSFRFMNINHFYLRVHFLWYGFGLLLGIFSWRFILAFILGLLFILLLFLGFILVCRLQFILRFGLRFILRCTCTFHSLFPGVRILALFCHGCLTQSNWTTVRLSVQNVRVSPVGPNMVVWFRQYVRERYV